MPEMDRGQTLQQAITIANGISVAAGNLQTTLSSITMGDMPDDVANPQQSLDFMQQQMAMLNELGESVNNAATQMSYLQQNVEMLSSSAISVQDAQQAMISAPQAEQPMAASGTFNLKKVGQFLPPQQPIPQPVQPQVQAPFQPQEGIPPQNAEPIEEFKFMDSAELRDWMEQQNDSMLVREKLLNEADEEKSDLIADLVKRFFETEIEEQKLDYAEEIWDNMPNSIKKESPQVQENVMPAHYVSPKSKAAETVQEANDSIKKLAQADAKKATTFNLHKTAQAKSMENVILYGPGQTYVDPFTRQPASEWSIVERNKGFGLVVDDVWNIDWERVWRQNVMDKYSRPYRDGDGNWVGGYIQKRFEVDKWIPEKNNLQLKPGQLRKDYIPEERLTETRMVAQRASANSPYESADKSKPFNWKEASTKEATASPWAAHPPKRDDESFLGRVDRKQDEEDAIKRDLVMRKKKKIREHNKDKTMVGGPPKSEHFRHKPEANQETSFNLKEAETKKKS